jgi:hypothetical protein
MKNGGSEMPFHVLFIWQRIEELGQQQYCKKLLHIIG